MGRRALPGGAGGGGDDDDGGGDRRGRLRRGRRVDAETQNLFVSEKKIIIFTRVNRINIMHFGT